MNYYPTKEQLSRPPPPPGLSKEHLGVWNGWTFKGDREVAREAAVKGHVELVTLFIATRRKISRPQSEDFFKIEVLLWVDELLTRNQIFRASHILNNIGLDPSQEFEKIFYKTTKKTLRDYIGNHLEKNLKLPDRQKHLWNFLEIILSNSVVMLKCRLEEESVECLDKTSDEWKHEVAGKLLLLSHVSGTAHLLPFLSAEVLWQQLLGYDKTTLLTAWINIHFNRSKDQSLNVSEHIQYIFEMFPITTEMINHVSDSKASELTQEIVLNELCQYGIFCHSDKQNLISVLDRVNQSVKVLNIYKTLSKSTSNIDLKAFAKLIADYCLEKKCYNSLNVLLKEFSISELLKYTKSSHLILLQDFKIVTNNKFNEKNLCDNILSVSQFLSEDCIAYFNTNPLILLALVFFARDISFPDVLKNMFVCINNVELSTVITNLLQKLNLLGNVYKKQLEGVKNNLCCYELLQRHLNIDVKKLFECHLNSRRIPNFNSPDLISKYGYTKKTNYLFYLKQYRPSISSKIFVITHLQNHGRIYPDVLQTVQKKVYRTALGYFESQEITSSCVAFLEMIGVNSDFLKVGVKAANILSSSGIKASEIKSLFLNIDSDPYAIQLLLESSVMSHISSFDISEGQQFVQAVKDYDVVVKFSTLYNLTLPEMFLKHCANHNQWLPFLIFAQLKNYPIAQIKTTLQYLKNPNLVEHLAHSIINDIQVDEQNILMRDRDSRKYLLSKIGVRKTADNISQNTDSLYSLSQSSVSLGSNSSSSGSEFLEIDISNVKATLLQTLIRCHNSTDPPRALLQACQLYRNPLLAVLATSYEPDSIITNWLTWLAVSTDLYQIFTNFESITTNAQAVTNLLNDCMKNQYPKTLLQGFVIFVPQNPLRIFVEFLNLLIDRQYDNTGLVTKLDAYKKAKSYRRDSVISESDFELTYLKNKLWIENTSLRLLASAIDYNFYSRHEKIQVVQTLCELQFETYLSTYCPSLKILLTILNNISRSGSDLINLDISLYFDIKTQARAIANCVSECLSQELYEIALNIARISDLPEELIALRMWQHKFENRDETEKSFWADCDKSLLEHHIKPDSAIDFFLSCVNQVQNVSEKYELYCLSQGWARKHSLPKQYELETQKWLAYISLDENWKKARDIIIDNWQPEYLSYKEMIHLVANIRKYDKTLPESSFDQLEKIALESLNRGNFLLSLKLEKMFGCGSGDLDIIKLCYSLAEGLVTPYQLSEDQNLLLSQNRQFRRFRSISGHVSSGSHISSSPYSRVSDDVDTVPIQDVLTLLHCLTEKLSHGTELAYSIFMMYRISINIELPYQVVASNTDHLKMLKDALGDDCNNKLEVVHDFIHVHKWTKEIITDFVCEEIVSAASHFVKSKSERFILWNINVDQQFHLILQLLQENCSLLGYKIYSYASALHQVQLSADLNFKISELALITELLIIAHECFTTDCNMEGISTILKKCQAVISHLLTLRSWKLIVRLLTGVGRYTEMNYVFQILKENEQFEFLLRKGSKRDHRLKIALLEYLKKYCPDNKELYKIVALHFTLFSEVALLWEREAQSVIRNLIAISKLEMQNSGLNPDAQYFVLFSNTDGTKLCLNKAIENYTHATEFHLQGEKLAKAMNSAKQAELIALQMSLLKGLPTTGTTFCLLNLNNGQINYFISSQLSFHQSYILVQAYNYQADWAFVLYEQCVLKTDGEYLEAFLQNLCLTDTLVHDISRKFQNANINTPEAIKNMKSILIKLPSVHTKYKLASDLGFTDLVEDLITKGQLAYLKDTVWKKGYKSLSA